MKIPFRLLFTIALLTAGVATMTTNNPIRSQLIGSQYIIATDPDVIPHVVSCNVPLANLLPSSIQIIQSNPKGVCLGGLTQAGGPPILGDVNRQTLLNVFAKFNNDLVGTVVNGVLICQVPCTNAFAREIETCNDLTPRPAALSYSIDAVDTC